MRMEYLRNRGISLLSAPSSIMPRILPWFDVYVYCIDDHFGCHFVEIRWMRGELKSLSTVLRYDLNTLVVVSPLNLISNHKRFTLTLTNPIRWCVRVKLMSFGPQARMNNSHG